MESRSYSMSSNKQDFIMDKYEEYIEMGFPSREARMLAESDYEYEYYDYEPAEETEHGQEL